MKKLLVALFVFGSFQCFAYVDRDRNEVYSCKAECFASGLGQKSYKKLGASLFTTGLSRLVAFEKLANNCIARNHNVKTKLKATKTNESFLLVSFENGKLSNEMAKLSLGDLEEIASKFCE